MSKQKFPFPAISSQSESTDWLMNELQQLSGQVLDMTNAVDILVLRIKMHRERIVRIKKRLQLA